MSIVSILAHRTSVFAQYAAHGEEKEQKYKLYHPILFGHKPFLPLREYRSENGSNLFEKIHATPPPVKE